MKYVASCSMGKDSICMVLRLIELKYPLDEVIYYDSGMEFECMAVLAEKIRNICKMNKIAFTVVYPQTTFLWNMAHREVHKKDGTITHGYKWCSNACRWGTGLKRQALHEVYKKYGSEAVVEYIGIAADEKQRIDRKRDGNRVKIYPLVEWNYTEAMALDYCHAHDIYWVEEGIELYDSGMKRVSCFCCGNKSISELKFMYEKLPKTFEKLKSLQNQVGVPYRGNMTIFDYEERFKWENAQISLFE